MGHVIGRHTYHPGDLNLRTWAEQENILIGQFCSIADQVTIFAGGLHRLDRVSTYPFDAVMRKLPGLDPVYQSTLDTVIGNDVWIGTRSIIMGGLDVGSGAVIGAGSVVFSSVPAYAIVAGNPARILRYRFSKSVVERLLRIAWWDWTDEKIIKNQNWFAGPISDFLAQFDPQEDAGHG